MTISATIIADSIASHGTRLTTFECVLPKSLQAQLNTHRKLSKNASSSRAIPTKKIIESVRDNPVMPIWTRNRPGMTGEVIQDQQFIDEAEVIWLQARDNAIASAKALAELGVHKQTVNRILEPFMFTKVVVTSTEYAWFNFLRNHVDAQGEIETLAKCIDVALSISTPKLLERGQWHLPYVTDDELSLNQDTQLKVSVARCARTSYKTFDNDKMSTVDKDLILYDDLLSSGHLSPFEHQGTPGSKDTQSGNFDGWVQYRQLVGAELYARVVQGTSK